MNQNNNYNFDPMTGQPIKQSVNYQQVQSQQQMNTEDLQNSMLMQQPKKNNKVVIIIVILMIIIGIFIFINHDKKKSINNSESNMSGSVEDDTDTTYDENGAFLFSIEDVSTVTNKGTVVIGKVQRGKIKVGDIVQIIGLDMETLMTEVIEIEMFDEQVDEAVMGDNVSIVLKNIKRGQVETGQVLAKPNSIDVATKFDADVYVLTKEEGGRHTPFFDGYRPQFYFRSVDITGTIDLPDNIEMVSPGDKVSFTITLINNVAMEVGTEFLIREGGRKVATGIVTKVY